MKTLRILTALLIIAISSPTFAMVDEAVVDHNSMATHGSTVNTSNSVGFPQLDTSTYASQIFWLAVVFILLYLLMSHFALPRVATAIERRNQVKEIDFNAATKANAEAQRLEESYTLALREAQIDARETISQAEADIASRISTRNAKFAEETRNRIESAEKSIAKAKTEASSSLKEIAAEIAAEMANRIGGGSANADDAKKIISSLTAKG